MPTPALQIPHTLGPVPDDVLRQMAEDAEAVALHDYCDVPGTYFALLLAPVLRELQQRRALDTAPRERVLSVVPDSRG